MPCFSLQASGSASTTSGRSSIRLWCWRRVRNRDAFGPVPERDRTPARTASLLRALMKGLTSARRRSLLERKISRKARTSAPTDANSRSSSRARDSPAAYFLTRARFFMELGQPVDGLVDEGRLGLGRQAPADPLAGDVGGPGGGVGLELADALPDLFVELPAGEALQALGLGGRGLGDAPGLAHALRFRLGLECADLAFEAGQLGLRRLGSGFGLGPARLGQPEGFPDGHGPLGEHGFDGFAHDERQAAEEDQEVDDLAEEIHARGNFAAHSPRIL